MTEYNLENKESVVNQHCTTGAETFQNTRENQKIQKNKRYFLKGIFMFLIAICFVSCAVTKTETAKVRDVAGIVLHVPTVADLDVPANRVTETLNIRLATNMKGLPILTEQVKNYTTAQLLKKHDADVLIEPRYSVEAALGYSKSTFTVTVSGYPAKYKNFRPMIESDTIWLKPLPPHFFPEKKQGSIILNK